MYTFMLRQEVSAIFFFLNQKIRQKIKMYISKRRKDERKGPKKHLFLLVFRKFGKKIFAEYAYVSEGV